MNLLRKTVFAVLLMSQGMTFAAALEDPNAAMVKETVVKLMKENHIPGVAVEMFVDGKPHSYYFGEANEAKKTPITKNTIFEIGSLTKLMTGLLLAQEVDMGKMRINDSIRKYDPSLPATFDNITLVDLATHTAGLPYSRPKEINATNELNQYLQTWKPESAPGNIYFYSNLSLGLLGKALEEETHFDYAKLYLAHIANPLKMQPIALDVPTKLKKFLAQGYDENGHPVPNTSVDLLPAAYGLKMSANDAQRFLSAAIGLPGTPERVLYPMRLTQTAYVKLDERDQGLAWQIHPLSPEAMDNLLDEPEEMNRGPFKVLNSSDQPKYNGNALIDKTGGTDGFRAYIALIPNKKSGIVILTNKYISNGAIVTAGREILFAATQLTTD